MRTGCLHSIGLHSIGTDDVSEHPGDYAVVVGNRKVSNTYLDTVRQSPGRISGNNRIM